MKRFEEIGIIERHEFRGRKVPMGYDRDGRSVRWLPRGPSRWQQPCSPREDGVGSGSLAASGASRSPITVSALAKQLQNTMKAGSLQSSSLPPGKNPVGIRAGFPHDDDVLSVLRASEWQTPTPSPQSRLRTSRPSTNRMPEPAQPGDATKTRSMIIFK